MATPAANIPRLRLVGVEHAEPDRASHTMSPQAQDVARANRLASLAGPTHVPQIEINDPRRALALQTRARLQGAMLTPERRDELMFAGKRMGLRPFESSLVIAMIQDEARQTMDQSHHMRSTVRKSGTSNHHSARWLTWWLGAAVSAAVLAAAIIRWIDSI